MARKNLNGKSSPIKRFLVKNSQKVQERTFFTDGLQETLSERFSDSEDHFVIDDLKERNYRKNLVLDDNN